MDFKELIKRVIVLISSPAKAWEEICVEEDKGKVQMGFVYPMIGLCGICYFIGAIWREGMSPLSFQHAMTNCCAILVALFGGYFLAGYGINRVGVEAFGMPDNRPLINQFTGYGLVITFLSAMMIGLFPDFLIFGIISHFYLLYIVWEGSRILIGIEEKNQMFYTVISSLLIVFCPLLLQFIFTKIVYILN